MFVDVNYFHQYPLPVSEVPLLLVIGPSPLKAIKNGEVNLKYDTKFIFAEVNAETVYWLCEGDDQPKPIRRSTNRVGKFNQGYEEIYCFFHY